MKRQDNIRITTAARTQTRVMTEPNARCIEISFLIAAMLVFMVMTGLVLSF